MDTEQHGYLVNIFNSTWPHDYDSLHKAITGLLNFKVALPHMLVYLQILKESTI